MKKLICSLVILLSIIVVISCAQSESSRLPELSYFKDKRTNSCFAYCVSTTSGGKVKSVTLIPCEKVPDNLLDKEVKLGK